MTTPFTSAMTDSLFRNVVLDDCGGQGTILGPGTKATKAGETPMHNGWAYLSC